MMGISLGEIFVVLVVIILVAKPNDMQSILKQIASWRKMVFKIKGDVLAYVDSHIDCNLDITLEDKEKLNFYLGKIIALNEKYDGDYTVDAVKAEYHKLIAHKHTDRRKIEVVDDKNEV